jgi:hypothetical protein
MKNSKNNTQEEECCTEAFEENLRPQVNLLAPENGGKIIRAPDASWETMVDGDDDTRYTGGIGEAVFGFKDDRSATFDTITVFIAGTDHQSIKDFELLAGNESPTGRFESIGKFSTQNELVMQRRDGRLQAHQEFHFAPVKARYVKIRLLRCHADDSYWNRLTHVWEFRLFGKLN